MTESNSCQKRKGLEADVRKALQKLKSIIEAQQTAFLADNVTEYMRLDKELELTMGTKERTIGPLQEHIREHGCRPHSVPPN